MTAFRPRCISPACEDSNSFHGFLLVTSIILRNPCLHVSSLYNECNGTGNSTDPSHTTLSRWFVPLAALIVFGVWFYIAPPGLLGKADAIGYAICHRIDERSFQIGDRQLALVRTLHRRILLQPGFHCSSLHSSARKKAECPAGNSARRCSSSCSHSALTAQTRISICSSKPPAAHSENIPNLYIPNNTLRLFTGSGMGIALASILYPAFNQSTAWKVT